MAINLARTLSRLPKIYTEFNLDKKLILLISLRLADQIYQNLGKRIIIQFTYRHFIRYCIVDHKYHLTI